MDDGTRRRPKQLDSARNVGPDVDVPLLVAEIVGQAWGFGIHVAEHETLIRLHARHFAQAPGRLVETGTIDRRFQRDGLEFAIRGELPAVIDARERLGGTGFRQAQPHSAMAALVQEGLDAAIFLAPDNNFILGHLGDHVIARVGQLAFMR